MATTTTTTTTSSAGTTRPRTSSTATAATISSHSRSRSLSSARPLRKAGHASTPNLNAAFRSSSSISASAPFTLRLAGNYDDSAANIPPVPRLPRKQSLSALSRPLAAKGFHVPPDPYPDVLDRGVNDENAYPGMLLSPSRKMPLPATPGRPLPIKISSSDDGPRNLAVGDLVDVPGNMHGTVRFIGTVSGKKGTFAGVELSSEFKARGKNSGDVDGVTYFNTDNPGAGIFLPLNKASRRAPPSPLPLTPTAFRSSTIDTEKYTAYTPSTPGVPRLPPSTVKGRGGSPEGKKLRQSLARPESPVRRLPVIPTTTAATPTTTGRASLGGMRTPSRYGTPTQNRFAQSVRGTSGDPAKNLFKSRAAAPRSNSSLGPSSLFDDDDDEPRPTPQRAKATNGGGGTAVGSISSPSLRLRPSSRAGGGDGEVERLRAQLEERERQLADQATTLNEMENSLTELQSLMGNPDALPRRPSVDDKNAQQLRGMLREKNEKISALTAEFDAHRADFRSTIDALETASSETQNLYEKRIEDLMQELKELEATRMESLDVDTVALQLRQLEELVQELEEGLEDARRGEAEARGEVEFLRGEVERTRAELRREREKTAVATNGARAPTSKELEQKEDEIRGLKAIIHSLSRDSVPSGPTPPIELPPLPRPASAALGGQREEPLESQDARDQLEHEIQELQSMLSDKIRHEEDLDREIETLRRASGSSNHDAHNNNNNRASSATMRSANASSLRDSRDTMAGSDGVVRSARPSVGSIKKQTIPPSESTSGSTPEADARSAAATENGSLWCDMCEASGHDVLSCTKFGTVVDAPPSSPPQAKLNGHARPLSVPQNQERDRDGLLPLRLNTALGHSHTRTESNEIKPRPLTPVKTRNITPVGAPVPVHVMPNPMEAGPVAGKGSGVVDESKWCALCERDGHDSVDCPFEDAF